MGQVPASLLSTLITAINGLRSDVNDLRRDFNTLQTKVNATNDSTPTYHHNAVDTRHGKVFTLFPKLPKEIPEMIWKISAGVPQIIAARLVPNPRLGVGPADFHPSLAAQSPHAPLFQVNFRSSQRCEQYLRNAQRSQSRRAKYFLRQLQRYSLAVDKVLNRFAQLH